MLARISQQLDQLKLSLPPLPAKPLVQHTPENLSHTHRSTLFVVVVVVVVVQTLFSVLTDGDDYVGGSYTVTFGTDANDVACARIGIVVDNVFEDIENFNTDLSPGGTANVVVGPQNNTVVLIDDLGRGHSIVEIIMSGHLSNKLT